MIGARQVVLRATNSLGVQLENGRQCGCLGALMALKWRRKRDRITTRYVTSNKLNSL
jgi:hypothetical protein